MKNPFLRDGLLMPIASLNRVKLMSHGDEVARGKFAGELLSSEYFHGLVSAHEDAERAALRLGTNLGYLLLTLKKGAPEDRAARGEWSEAHWEYWAGVEKIYLCGGLSGLGKTLLDAANAVINEAGADRYKLEIPENSGELALIGAARAVQGNPVVLDFGHSFVKRAFFADSQMNQLDKVASEHVSTSSDDGVERRETQLLHSFVMDTIAHTYQEALDADAEPDAAALVFANYVRDGAFHPGRGGYAKLGTLSDNYASFISDELYKRMGRRLPVTLFHDGTAAALAIDERKTSAVISLGTGLGVGFCSNK